jgi:hypothetical protein
MAGSVDLLQRCFAGLETRQDRLILNPYWPDELGLLEFTLRYREHLLTVQITDGEVRLSSAPWCTRTDRRCRAGARKRTLEPGNSVTFDHLDRRRSPERRRSTPMTGPTPTTRSTDSRDLIRWFEDLDSDDTGRSAARTPRWAR